MPYRYPPEFRWRVLDLLAAGRSVASLAEDLEVSDQTIYNWRRQDRIDRGLEPGPTPVEKTELQAARRRIAELETELVVRRGFGWVEGGASSLDFGDYLLGGFVPDEGFGVLVPVIGPGVDRFDELAHASEAVPA